MSTQKMGSGLRILGFVFITLHITFYTFHGLCAGPGTTGAQFLKISVGSRPVAMGEAFVGVADDVNAICWNPAGLAQVKEHQVSLIATEWFQSIHYGYLGYCQPLLGGVIGMSGVILWIDGIEQRGYTDPTGETIERYIPARDMAISISYGRALQERINAGLTLKVLYRQLDDRTSAGVALDLGLLCKLGQEKWTLGVALQNLGYESPFITEQDQLPMNIKIGVANKYLEDKLTLAADINYGIMDNVFSIGGGIDWWVHPVFAIRTGYKYNTTMSTLGFLSGLTVGGGFKLNTFDIDYALVPYGDLGLTHRISLIAKF